MTYTAHFRVWRGDAGAGDLEPYEIEVNEGEVVLDILHRLQATQTPDLAVRWNCKAGKCGSCSAEINGRPRLLCMTRMSTFGPDDTITVTPLRAFPVIRDLVTDVSFNYAKAREVPSFRPPADLAPGDYRMQQVDVERSQEFRKCIECYLCQNTCHVIRDHEENKPAFAGPRFFIRLAELDMHPLDTRDRKREAQDAHGLGLCNITKCCTEVCPESIKITDNGIIPMKERVVDSAYDPLFRVGDLLPRRRSLRNGHGADGDDPVALERSARTRLESRKGDRRACSDLADALVAQGRLADAAAVTRDLLDSGRTRLARLAAHDRHAWTLLAAVEAGQLGGRAAAEAAEVLAAARRLAGSGAVLDSTLALQAVVDGRPEEAERLVAGRGAWHREEDAADNALTHARALAATGRGEQARAVLADAAARWPRHPRLPAVEREVAAASGRGGEPSGERPTGGGSTVLR